jgi:hypothetical protein
MNDMNLFGREDAGGAVMSLCHGRGWVIVSPQKDLGDERGNRNDRIGGIEEMLFTDAGARAFCEVAGEDDERPGFDKAGGEECSPVVVSMVGVKDARFGSAKNACEGENLIRSKLGEWMEGKLLSCGG